MVKDEPLDFSAMTWSAAYAALAVSLKREYVFTQWKAIDWDSLHLQYAPRIQEAETRADKQAYFLALREFLFAVPDAGLRLWGDDWDLRRKAIAGSYGLAIRQLGDGRVFAYQIALDGSATRGGIQPGAQIISWNDEPIQTALNHANILWAEHPPTTHMQRRLQQCRFLMHAPLGTRVRVQFQNPKRNASEFTVLVADTHSLAPDLVFGTWHGRKPIHGELLASGIGYIAIHAFPTETVPGFWHSAILEHWRESLVRFLRAKAAALVIDLRHCVGINHLLAARLAGFFYRRPRFYSVAGQLDNSMEHGSRLKRDGRTLIQVVPQDLYWPAPVAVLVNPETLGAAEGFARVLQQSRRGTIVGAESSGGSFGTMTAEGVRQVWLPEGYGIMFPLEAGLNQDGVIQIESNRLGEGGVRPDRRVPENLGIFKEQFINGQDVELTFALIAPRGIPDGRK